MARSDAFSHDLPRAAHTEFHAPLLFDMTYPHPTSASVLSCTVPATGYPSCPAPCTRHPRTPRTTHAAAHDADAGLISRTIVAAPAVCLAWTHASFCTYTLLLYCRTTHPVALYIAICMRLRARTAAAACVAR
ncbi:hypothetical protein GY45DRAFT_1316336 [Cubamyces sp. BRFM 1775]|nr:hypothetical protein GY45DRAFT_1316336 [Cubamyces sp. BRFM 1775]